MAQSRTTAEALPWRAYRAVLATTPRHVSGRNNLALSLAVTGQFDEAVALLTPLARSSSATPRIRENLALVYGLMGDAERAAMLSRSDLDDGSIQANLAFIAAVRTGRSRSEEFASQAAENASEAAEPASQAAPAPSRQGHRVAHWSKSSGATSASSTAAHRRGGTPADSP